MLHSTYEEGVSYGTGYFNNMGVVWVCMVFRADTVERENEIV